MEGCVTEKLSHYLYEAMSQIVEYGLVSAQNWMQLGMNPGNVCVLNKMHLDMKVVEEILQSAVKTGELAINTPISSIQHCIIAEFYGIVVTWCISNGSVSAIERMNYFNKNHLNQLLSDFQKQS